MCKGLSCNPCCAFSNGAMLIRHSDAVKWPHYSCPWPSRVQQEEAVGAFLHAAPLLGLSINRHDRLERPPAGEAVPLRSGLAEGSDCWASEVSVTVAPCSRPFMR